MTLTEHIKAPTVLGRVRNPRKPQSATRLHLLANVKNMTSNKGSIMKTVVKTVHGTD